jgi:hypothetical protein
MFTFVLKISKSSTAMREMKLLGAGKEHMISHIPPALKHSLLLRWILLFFLTMECFLYSPNRIFSQFLTYLHLRPWCKASMEGRHL